jgi:hypothetical protein
MKELRIDIDIGEICHESRCKPDTKEIIIDQLLNVEMEGLTGGTSKIRLKDYFNIKQVSYLNKQADSAVDIKPKDTSSIIIDGVTFSNLDAYTFMKILTDIQYLFKHYRLDYTAINTRFAVDEMLIIVYIFWDEYAQDYFQLKEEKNKWPLYTETKKK